MAPVLLLLAAATIAALTGPAAGTGTIIELHELPFFGGGDPTWVVPDPTVGSPGAPAGCINLDKKFNFQSGRFYWNETAGKARCHFIWFYFGYNCGDGGARGVEVTAKPTDGSPWVVQDAIYSRTTYWKIQNGRSIGCSFEEDPCEAFPCEDPNAVCNSTLGWSWKDDKGKAWAHQTRNCSACKDGFALGAEGKCVDLKAACTGVKCDAPQVCQADSALGARCVCPPEAPLDPTTGKCKSVSQKAWLSALNDVRDQAKPAVAGLQKTAEAKANPIRWDHDLAMVAQNWTDYLNSTQCNANPVILTKIPGGNYSESDVWVSWSTDETSAVQLWAPSPTDASNPRTARITDGNTQITGCGKTMCGGGAFFTCLFWPKTH